PALAHYTATLHDALPIFREEIFGPVLSVSKAKDFDQALELANDSEFALTGGCYSRSPVNLERAKAELVCGNLYLNRTITGAIVEDRKSTRLNSSHGSISY